MRRTTKQVIEWMQKNDPEGKMLVDVCGDEINLIEKKKGTVGVYHVRAELDMSR